MVVNVGDKVETYDGHKGTVVKKYFVTGRYEMYVHIQEADGRIWYCPASCISRKDVKLNEETIERELAEILRRNADSISSELTKGLLGRTVD